MLLLVSLALQGFITLTKLAVLAQQDNIMILQPNLALHVQMDALLVRLQLFALLA